MKPQATFPQAARLFVAFFVVLFLFNSFFLNQAFATAGINRTINFQGKLVNKVDGINITDSTYSFTFKLYDDASGGTQLPSGTPWTETQGSVVVTNGVFRVALGSITALPSTLDFNDDSLYLDISFNGETFGSRVRLAAVPFAFNAEKVSGLTVTNTTGTLTIPNAKTISFADDFTTSGSNPLTLNTVGTTSVTLPTTGTLATLAGNEILTNKTIGSTGLIFSGATVDIDTAVAEGLVLQGRAASTLQTTAGEISLQPAGSGTTSSVQIGVGGVGSTAPDYLGLDVKSDTGDPAGGYEGAMYYNTFDNKFRCYQGAAWADCLYSGGTTITFTADSGSSATALGATRTIAGGTNGVDTSDNESGTLTINFDSTEVGTTTFGSGSDFTWTFNGVGGTDPAITFGADSTIFTSGTASFSNRLGIGTTAPTVALDVVGAGLFSTNLTVNGNTTLGDATSDTVTLTAKVTGATGAGLGFSDASFTTCTALETVAGMLTCGTDDVGGGAGVWTDGTATAYLAVSSDWVGIGTSSPTDKLNILASTSGSTSFDGLQIDFTQDDDADATDTNAGLNINITSSSSDADTVLGINIANITGGPATEYGLQIGSGWDSNLYFNDTTTNIGIASSGTFTFNDGTNTLFSIVDAGTTGNVTTTGTFAVNGNTTLGDATTDTVTINGIPTFNASTATFSVDTNVALTGGVNGLAFDTSTLSIDASNNRIGIGTTAPGYDLDIGDFTSSSVGLRLTGLTNTGSSSIRFSEQSDAFGFSLNYSNVSNIFSIQRHESDSAGVSALSIERSTGFVGIGTTDPTVGFEVGGDGVATTPYSLLNGLRISGGDLSNTIWNAGRNIVISRDTGGIIQLTRTSQPTLGLTVDTTTGYVGIGTTAPADKLDVTIASNGSATLDGISVNFTQSDDADSADTNAGLNINITSSSSDADTLLGINIANITASASAVERGLQIGSGWDSNLYFNDTTATIDVASGGTITFTGNTTLGDATSDTVTLTAKVTGATGAGLGFSDASFTTCTALETVAGMLTCGTDDLGGGGVWTAGAGTIYLTTNTDRVGMGTTAPTDKVNILTSAGGSASYDGLQIDFTQDDDADSADTNAGLNINITSSSNDFDTLKGINVANITGGSATETGLVIGSGWDYSATFAGYVGIGTTAPSTGLELVGGFLQKIDSSTGFRLMNAAGTFDNLVFDSSASQNHLKIYDPTAPRTAYVDIYYSDGEAVFAASTGITRIGSGSGDVNIALTGATDEFVFDKAYELSSSYTNTGEFRVSRTLIATTFLADGNVVRIEDLSSGTNALSVPNVLYLNQNNTTFGGNLILAQTGGTSDKFRVTTTGDGFFAGLLGIGTTAPQDALDVYGNFRVTKIGDIGKYLTFRTDGSGVDVSSNGGTDGLFLNYDGTENITLGNNNKIWMVPASGSVGVGHAFNDNLPDKLNILASTSGSDAFDGLQIDLTQSDDADGTDVNSGLNINLVSSSSDPDVLNGISITIAGTSVSARERGISIGTGFDDDIYFASAEAKLRIQSGGQIDITDNFNGGNGSTGLPLGRFKEYFADANYGVWEAGGFVNIDGSFYQDQFTTVQLTQTQAPTAKSNMFGDDQRWGNIRGTACTVGQNNSTVSNFTGVGGFVELRLTTNSSACYFYMGYPMGAVTATTIADTSVPGILNAANKFVMYYKVKHNGATSTNRIIRIGADNYTAANRGPVQAAIGASNTRGGIWFANHTMTGTATNQASIGQWVGMAKKKTEATHQATVTCGANSTIITNQYALMRIEARQTNDVQFFLDNNISNGINLKQCSTGITNTNAIPAFNLKPAVMVNNQSTAAQFSLFIDLFAFVQDDPRPAPGQEAPIVDNSPAFPPPPPDIIAGADLAEYYYFQDKTSVESGDVVVLGSYAGQAEKSENKYDRKLLGVVAEWPGLTLGEAHADGHPIALSGRAPVKVNGSGGAIKVGDSITSSDVAGIAMKASEPGKIIGTAMENYDPATDGPMKKIMINVHTGYYIGEEFGSTNGDEMVFGDSQIATESGSIAQNGTVVAVRSYIYKGFTEFWNKVTFKEAAEFWANVVFKSTVRFEGEVQFNNNSAGYAEIKSGERFVDVQFDKEYENEPVVNLSIIIPKVTQEKFEKLIMTGECMAESGISACQDYVATQVLDDSMKAGITAKTKQGFMILLNKTAPVDVTFSWQAVAVKNVKTTVSKTTAELLKELSNSKVAGVATSSAITSYASAKASTNKTVQVSPNELGYLRLRAQPTTESEDLTHIPVGEVVQYSENTNGWYKVVYEGKTGWINADYVTLDPVTTSSASPPSPSPTVGPTITPTPSTSAEASASVKTSADKSADKPVAPENSVTVLPNDLGFVRMRSQSNTEGEDLAHIPIGTTLSFTGTEYGWYKVSYEGVEGWASGAYVAAGSSQ